MKHGRLPGCPPLLPHSSTRRFMLVPVAALFLLLLVASVALAAPPVDGWVTISLSGDVGDGVHARVDDGRVVWVDGRPPAATPIVLRDVATGQRQVIAADGSSPEIDGDHVAYFGPDTSPGSDGGDVFLYTISTGETVRLTNDAETKFNYRLNLHGNMVIWVSATRLEEGPLAGDASLLMHDIAKNGTAPLVMRESGAAGLGDYVADAERVVWWILPSSGSGGSDLEVWLYSATTEETREITSLRNYNIVALPGDTLLAYRQWSTEGGVQHFVRCDLRSEELRPLDAVLDGSAAGGSVVADGSFVAWAGYADGSTFVALSDLRIGQMKRILTTGYDVGGLVLCGDLLAWHGQFRGRYATNNNNYIFVYDRARDTVTRVATLAGHNGSYGTDGSQVAFTTGNSWPDGWDDPQQFLLACPTGPEIPAFLDAPGTHLYRTAIQGLKERQIVAGYPSPAGDAFRPDATLTRAQFAKMLALALDIPVDPSAIAPFDDVPSGLFPGAYVAALAERGIVHGTEPRIFAPYGTLTRAQLMTMLVRAIDNVEPGLLGTPPPTSYPQGYQGALGAFDPTHAPFMLRADLNGLVDGLVGYGFSGKWDPWRPATRAEAAQVLWNFLGKEGHTAPSTMESKER